MQQKCETIHRSYRFRMVLTEHEHSLGDLQQREAERQERDEGVKWHHHVAE